MNTHPMRTVWTYERDPFLDFRREMSGLFGDFLAHAAPREDRARSPAHWQPAADIEESPAHFLFTLDLPGIPKDQINIEVSEHQLLISGERPSDPREKNEAARYSERRYGAFQRSFALPQGVDSTKIEAEYRDGTLRVYVPKIEAAQPRTIKISSGTGTGFFGRLIGQHFTPEKEGRGPPRDQNESRAS